MRNIKCIKDLGLLGCNFQNYLCEKLFFRRFNMVFGYKVVLIAILFKKIFLSSNAGSGNLYNFKRGLYYVF